MSYYDVFVTSTSNNNVYSFCIWVMAQGEKKFYCGGFYNRVIHDKEIAHDSESIPHLIS